MSTETRLYSVRDKSTHKVRLIEAANPSQALRHVATDAFEVTVAGSKTVAALCSTGTKVEVANEAPNP